MVSIEFLTQLLAWSALINIGVLLFATVMIVLLRDTVTKIHARMFGLDEKDIAREYFRYLANYKIAILVFSLVPYLAIRVFS